MLGFRLAALAMSLQSKSNDWSSGSSSMIRGVSGSSPNCLILQRGGLSKVRANRHGFSSYNNNEDHYDASNTSNFSYLPVVQTCHIFVDCLIDFLLQLFHCKTRGIRKGLRYTFTIIAQSSSTVTRWKIEFDFRGGECCWGGGVTITDRVVQCLCLTLHRGCKDSGATIFGICYLASHVGDFWGLIPSSVSIKNGSIIVACRFWTSCVIPRCNCNGARTANDSEGTSVREDILLSTREWYVASRTCFGSGSRQFGHLSLYTARYGEGLIRLAVNATMIYHFWPIQCVKF